MSEHKCHNCERTFNSADALAMHNKSKHPETHKEPFLTAKKKKKIKNWAYIVIVLGIIIGVVYLISSSVKTLPPTDMQGHIEEWPQTQIQKSPIQIIIFKHILEHTDTPSKRPGVIISYNCKDYQCESSLIEKLEAFTQEYDYVYVAPFKNMDAKIALTKLGKQKILENYDEKMIREFIER